MFEVTENGHETVEQAIEAIRSASAVIPPTALRRLAVLRDVARGAAAAAQAAVDVANQRQTQLQEALTAACEDAGMKVPQDSQTPVDLDWDTGRVQLKP